MNAWLKKAKSFLDGAITLVKMNQSSETIGPSVGFLSWQAAENSLKAVCTGHNYPRDHNLSNIINHIRSNNLMNESELMSLYRPITIVTGSATYNDARYPNKDLQYWENMPQEILMEVTRAAQAIYDICSTNVSSSKIK